MLFLPVFFSSFFVSFYSSFCFYASSYFHLSSSFSFYVYSFVGIAHCCGRWKEVLIQRVPELQSCSSAFIYPHRSQLSSIVTFYLAHHLIRYTAERNYYTMYAQKLCGSIHVNVSIVDRFIYSCTSRRISTQMYRCMFFHPDLPKRNIQIRTHLHVPASTHINIHTYNTVIPYLEPEWKES